MDTPDRPASRYQFDLATLGYAIGRLLRHSSLRTQRSLVQATKQFLDDVGLSSTALDARELETVLYHVGRGYANSFLAPQSRADTAHTRKGGSNRGWAPVKSTGRKKEETVP